MPILERGLDLRLLAECSDPSAIISLRNVETNAVFGGDALSSPSGFSVESVGLVMATLGHKVGGTGSRLELGDTSVISEIGTGLNQSYLIVEVYLSVYLFSLSSKRQKQWS